MKYYINISKEDIKNLNQPEDYVWIWGETKKDYGEYEVELLKDAYIVKKDGEFLSVSTKSILYKN